MPIRRVLRIAKFTRMVLLAALLAVPVLLVSHRAAFAAGGGSIQGIVVNGTHSNAPVASQQVTLQETANGTVHDIATTTSDAQGHFTFSGLAVGDGATYAVYTRFQGGLFPSTALQVQSTTPQTAQLTVYDVTQSDAALHISHVTLLVNKVNQKNGLISVGEFVTFSNSGKSAFVGTSAAANGKPTGLLLFSVPPGASNLTLGLGFSGVQTITIGTGFGSAATVPPGDSVFAFAYDIPYSGTQGPLSYKAEYTTDSVTTLVPPTMFVTPGNFSAQGIIDAYGLRYQQFQTGTLKPATQASLTLGNLPAAGEPQDLDVKTLALLAGVLALLAAAAILLYLKRGALAVALRLMPPSVVTGAGSSVASEEAQAQESERQALLHQLLALQQARAAGTCSVEDYKRQEAEVRAALRALIAAGGTAAGAAPPQPQEAEPVADTETADSATETARALPGGGR